ncbi:hypothetical protein CL634_07970 [bacterium]|nr:hypothetical protein [bacterium]
MATQVVDAVNNRREGSARQAMVAIDCVYIIAYRVDRLIAFRDQKVYLMDGDREEVMAFSSSIGQRMVNFLTGIRAI